jgi:class 3 adenylate cyclase
MAEAGIAQMLLRSGRGTFRRETLCLGVAVAESVELATILLTDLVGSTRLANSVGPARADELREEHFELLRDAVQSPGGREVKNTGDGLMFAFASASAAVRCAVAMQQRLERRYRQAEQALHVRIGLAAGESTVKDGDYFGMPSIVAARLCAKAPSDGILISGMAKSLAGRCDGIEFASAGEVELKGFDEPVEAFSVSWTPLGDEAGAPSRWPLPALLRSVPPVAYVGREVERAALEEAMNLARSGKRQVVLLAGEPGIGKTRLASYGAHSAHAAGFAVAWGACTEELAVPYEPWIGVCSHLVEQAPAELIAGHVERHGGELSRLARNLVQRSAVIQAPQSSDPETERYLLFSAVVGLLAAVAETVPLCVVLDDLHWADAQSLALLKHLLRAAEQAALQVIVTYRDSDLGKDHPLTAVLADLRSLQGVQRITLSGLGADEVAEIMTAIAGHELEQDAVELAAQIAVETDGNPFFVAEILRGLSESGAVSFDAGARRWSIDASAGIALPESVREVIERRVERLGEESLEALRLAAVVGREFDLELLAAVVEMDEAHLLDELEAAVAASVLAESSDRLGRFRFAHALINQTLYDGLGATRRARMHERVARALEALYAADLDEHLTELALHWRMAAVPIEQSKAAGYALRAGQKALANLAPSEAVKLFGEAVELIGEPPSRERAEALIGLGQGQLQTGDPAYRETLLQASSTAVALGDAELAATAALSTNWGDASSPGAIDQERIAAIERALELDEPPHPARRARLLALHAQELAWSPDFAHRKGLAEEAIGLARQSGDNHALAAVLQSAWIALWSTEALELRTALIEELAQLAPTVGDPALELRYLWAALHTAVERGELQRASAELERERVMAEQLGDPTGRWVSSYHAAAFELLRGDLAGAERLAARALVLGQEAGQADAGLIYGTQLSGVYLYRGRAAELIGGLEESIRALPGIVALKGLLAISLCWAGRKEEAATIIEAAARDRFAHITPGVTKLTALVQYADCAAQTGSSEAAAILYELLEPAADQIAWMGASGIGNVRTYLGLLAAVLDEPILADRHLGAACEFNRANDVPLYEARGQLGWAEALAARDEIDAAREHAMRALELAREYGYGAFEPRAAALVETGSAAGA